MIINTQKLEDYRKQAYARLGLALHLEEWVKLYSSPVPSNNEEVSISTNMVPIPSDFDDELIEEIFDMIATKVPSHIIASSQKQCYFDSEE